MINGINLARAIKQMYFSGCSFDGLARKPDLEFKLTDDDFESPIEIPTTIPATNATINIQVKLSANLEVLMMLMMNSLRLSKE